MKVADELVVILKMVGKDGKAKFPIYESEELYNTNIDDLELDTRGKRALRDGNISTIRDLVDKWNTLEKIKGTGRKTVNKIHESLVAYQYSLLNDAKKKRYLERIIELNT